MSEIKNNKDEHLHIGSLYVTDVRNWRESLESYFESEWPKLTEIIHRLEESVWDDLDKDSGNFQEQATETTRRIAVEEPPDQMRKLTELAKQIDDQINRTQSSTARLAWE